MCPSPIRRRLGILGAAGCIAGLANESKRSTTTDPGRPPVVRPPVPPVAAQPKRFQGTANLDSARAGRDASRIAAEVISQLVGLIGAEVTVTIEIAATVPGGVPDNVVRTVTENSRTLKFTSQGFEAE